MLLAFARGVWALGGKSLWWDESLSLHRVQESLGYVLSNQIVLTDNVQSVTTIDNHPPLYFAILWLAVRVWGTSEFGLRFLSLISVVLMVPLLYRTGRLLAPRSGQGWAAAALGALSPIYLWYGQEARMYALFALLSLLSFYFFVGAFFCPPEAGARGRPRLWTAAYILTAALFIFTHYLSVLVVAFELAALGWLVLERKVSRRTLAWTVAALLALAASSLGYGLLTLPSSTSQAGFRFLPLPELLRDLLNSFSLGLSVDVADWPVMLADLVFLVFLVIGFLRLVPVRALRGRGRAAFLLAGYLLVPLLAIYLLSYVQPAYMNSRHLILITPAFYLLVGAGLAIPLRSLRRNTALAPLSRQEKEQAASQAAWNAWAIVPLLGWLVVLTGVGFSTYSYFFDPRYDKDRHREWGEYLRDHVRPGDVVVVDPPHIAELYDYYAGSEAPWIGLPPLHKPREESIPVLQELLAEYDRVWLAFSHTPPWGDRRRFPESWLNEQAFRADYKAFGSYASTVLMACYLRGWPSVQRLPDDAQAAGARYDTSGSLRLTGYRLLSPPEPGKQLHVQLYWAVDRTPSEEASVLLRLVDPEGRVWGQGEQCPFNGLYPMWQWQAGLLIEDEHQLLIEPGTPPGAYELELLLISRPGDRGCAGEPGPVLEPTAALAGSGRGDRLLLGAVAVQRSMPAGPLEENAAGAPAPRTDLEPAHRLRAQFGALNLLGYDLSPAELEPGERLDLALFWQASGSGLPDSRFRLRLVGPSGQVHQEVTIRPVGEDYPAGLWAAGDQLKGQFSFWLADNAPAGRYHLELLPDAPLQETGWRAVLRRLAPPRGQALRFGRLELRPLQAEAGPSAGPIPTPAALEVSHPLLATLGDRVRFLGYDLDTDPEGVPAGSQLSFTLYWQPLRRMNVSYSVFTHLLGPASQIVGQADGLPQQGAYPTTLWQPGEVIADRYRMVVDAGAAPGQYPLEIGMYRLENGVRLEVVDATGRPLPDGRILLPAITILPPRADTAAGEAASTATPAAQPAAPQSPYQIYLPLLGIER